MLSSNNWYAVSTRPNAEKKVFERLTASSYEAYLPLVSSIREWTDRKKKIESPLISTFVFVKLDPTRIYDVLKIQGALGILKYLGKPAIIKEQEIENLKILMNDTSEVSKLENIDFERGEDVLVTKGPFMGLVAQSVIIKGKRRIIVSIEALGSVMEVNLPLSFVIKVGKKQ
jgi:transcriptional antiterminator RfaH